jgi:hypothetical protein
LWQGTTIVFLEVILVRELPELMATATLIQKQNEVAININNKTLIKGHQGNIVSNRTPQLECRTDIVHQKTQGLGLQTTRAVGGLSRRF